MLRTLGLVSTGEQDVAPVGRPRSLYEVPVSRWCLAIALVVLNVLDVLMTKWILANGGEEANPIMASIIHDPAAPLLIKVSMALLIGGLLMISPIERRFVDRATFAVVLIYTGVIGWNISVMVQAAQAS